MRRRRRMIEGASGGAGIGGGAHTMLRTARKWRPTMALLRKGGAWSGALGVKFPEGC